MGSKERVREERRERMTEMMGELEINVKKKKMALGNTQT